MPGVIICAGCGESIDPDNESFYEYISNGFYKHTHADKDCLADALELIIITPEEVRLQRMEANANA